eukprot:gene15286-18098_t
MRWNAQLLSYNPVTNVVYMNANGGGPPSKYPDNQSLLLKFDFDQHSMDVTYFPISTNFDSSVCDLSTGICYFGGSNSFNPDRTLDIVTYDMQSGNMTTRVITMNVTLTDYLTYMYLYNSKFFVGMAPAAAKSPSVILEVDMLGNSSNILASIPDTCYYFNEELPFVFDQINGCLTLACGKDGSSSAVIEFYSLDLDTYELTHTSIRNTLPNGDIEGQWLMTTS